MIVVADTSPLHDLILIHSAEALPRFSVGLDLPKLLPILRLDVRLA